MKGFAFAVASLLVLVGTTVAQAQTTEANPWFDAAPAAISPVSYPTGWQVAPGTNPTVSARPSTDYQGRPLKARARKAPPVAATVDAPVYETGWSSAPGMALSLHQRPTTDYWGRPLKPAVRKAPTSLSAEPELGTPVAVQLRK